MSQEYLLAAVYSPPTVQAKEGLAQRSHRGAHCTVVRSLMVALVAIFISSCGLGEAVSSDNSGELGGYQKLAADCPRDKSLAEFVADDLSGSSRDDTVFASRLGVISELVKQTVVCQGRFRLVAFSASSVATTIVYDKKFELDGATDIARLRRAPEVVENALGEIESNLKAVDSALPTDGSDIRATLTMGDEFGRQLGDGYQLRFHVLTDGVSTTEGSDLGNSRLTVAEAEGMANGYEPPRFPADSAVTFVGIGKVAGINATPSSAYVEALKTFYRVLCKKTAAGSCRVVTDYTA